MWLCLSASVKCAGTNEENNLPKTTHHIYLGKCRLKNPSLPWFAKLKWILHYSLDLCSWRRLTFQWQTWCWVNTWNMLSFVHKGYLTMFIDLIRVIYFLSAAYQSELPADWLLQPLQLAMQVLHGRAGDQFFVILPYQSSIAVLVN